MATRLNRANTFIMLLILAGTCWCLLGRRAEPHEKPRIGPAHPVKVAKIPTQAEIVYHIDGYIYVMDRNGQNVTQITFENPHHYEHVAVSFDRRFVVANEQKPNPEGKPGGLSLLWLFDLGKGTEARLVPEFDTAGNGGVAWDAKGFVYFAGKERDVFPDPKTQDDFIANAAANDVYRIKFDGTDLQRITNTKTRGEADVSVSEDGTLVTFMDVVTDPGKEYTEIWVINSDGTNPRLVYAGGKPSIASVHDPEVSPENTKVVFSKVDRDVPPNFPKNPVLNTAHDLWTIRLDGTEFTRLTKPGPISIIPNWKDGLVVYTEISEQANYIGASIVHADGHDQVPKRIKPGASSPKWIP